LETVGRYVALRKSGNRYWGLCPFHGEKTPSFTVNPDKQIFYCFGCGASGDLFAFRMRHEGLEFPEAVRALAGELGIQIPESGRADGGRSSRLYAANDSALGYFRRSLRSSAGRAGAKYFEERGLPADLIERFQLGYAPAGWEGLQAHLAEQQVRLEDAEAAGLIAPRQNGDGFYDRFRDRVMFPISDPSGRIAGFGGRSLDGDPPKYMNSPETSIYRKGRVLFGLPQALEAIRKRDRAIVVEGYFDVLALHRAGLSEAVAPCGTALTAEHAHRIRRYTREVILLFDGDSAGQQAAERSLPVLLREDLRVRAVFLPSGEDPDTLVQKRGGAALRDAVESARPLVDALIDQRIGFARAAGAWEAADSLERVVPLLAALTDGMQRASYIREVATRLEVFPEVVQAALDQYRPTDTSASTREPAEASASPQDAAPIHSTFRELLRALTAYPSLLAELAEISPDFDPADATWVPDLRVRELFRFLFDASARHGERCVAHLLSPADDALPEELRALFSSLASGSSSTSRKDARQVLVDCMNRLESQQLKQRHSALQARLASCSGSDQQETVLEELQQLLEEKRSRDQRQRTQPWCS